MVLWEGGKVVRVRVGGGGSVYDGEGRLAYEVDWLGGWRVSVLCLWVFGHWVINHSPLWRLCVDCRSGLLVSVCS